MTEHLNEPISIARKYLTVEQNRELSDLFDEFVGNPKNSVNEEGLKATLYELSQEYPRFVYDPFYRLYNQLKRGEQ